MSLIATARDPRRCLLFSGISELRCTGKSDNQIRSLVFVKTGDDHRMYGRLLLGVSDSRNLVACGVHKPYCQSREGAGVRENSEIGSLPDGNEAERSQRLDGILVENGCPLPDDGDMESLGEAERFSQKAHSGRQVQSGSEKQGIAMTHSCKAS